MNERLKKKADELTGLFAWYRQIINMTSVVHWLMHVSRIIGLYGL